MPQPTHEVYLDEEIRRMKKPAGWYRAEPARVTQRHRGGRMGSSGYKITALGCYISEREFTRLEKAGCVREASLTLA